MTVSDKGEPARPMLQALLSPRALAAVIATMMLTGCVAPQPSETTTPTAEPSTSTPVPTADADVAALVLSGIGVSTTTAEGQPISTLSFEETSGDAVAFITDAIGSPPVTTTEDYSACQGGVWDLSTWSDVLTVKASAGGGAIYSVIFEGAQTADGTALTLTTGQNMGDDVSEFISALPASERYADAGLFMFDVVGTSDTGAPRGGWASVDPSGTLTAAHAPGGFGDAFC